MKHSRFRARRVGREKPLVCPAGHGRVVGPLRHPPQTLARQLNEQVGLVAYLEHLLRNVDGRRGVHEAPLERGGQGVVRARHAPDERDPAAREHLKDGERQPLAVGQEQDDIRVVELSGDVRDGPAELDTLADAQCPRQLAQPLRLRPLANDAEGEVARAAALELGGGLKKDVNPLDAVQAAHHRERHGPLLHHERRGLRCDAHRRRALDDRRKSAPRTHI